LLFELVREANTAIDAGEFRKENVEPVGACLRKWDDIFDVLGPTRSDAREVAREAQPGMNDATIQAKVEDREQARRQRNFALADRIRLELTQAGILLEDTKDGVRWRRK
jgi:cysteinyl-tRNA synthetase